MKYAPLKLSFLLFFLVSLQAHAFSQKKASKNSLCKKWVFTKYKIMGVEYDLTNEKEPDMLHLSADQTFDAIEEGKRIKGKWQYVEEKKMLVLTDENEEVVKMMKIERMKDEEMVCSIVTDWQYDMTVFMTSEKPEMN